MRAAKASTISIALALALRLYTVAAESAASGTKPHVLLILADDFSWGNLGVSYTFALALCYSFRLSFVQTSLSAYHAHLILGPPAPEFNE